MGVPDKETTNETDSKTPNLNISRLIVTLTIVFAFLAPVAFTVNLYWGSNISIIAILWTMYMSEHSIDFYFVSPSMTMFVIFPFLLLRLALPYQLNKYYQNRTTRSRTAFAAILADIPFIIILIPTTIMYIISGGGIFFINAPSPIMMIFGLLVLWRRPMPKAKVPWGEVERTKDWWEEEQSDTPSSNKSKTPW